MNHLGHWWRTTKRWLVLVHLYLGVVLSLLFAMWFITGVVLLYAPFPGFGVGRAYERLPALECGRCARSVSEALGVMRDRLPETAVRIGMATEANGLRAVFRYTGTDRRVHAIDANTLAPLQPLEVEGAIPMAAAYAGTPVSTSAAHGELLAEPDQWTVEKVLRDQLPLVRVDLGDAAGTRVYVSLHGHEAIAQSTRRDRALAWLGAIPHWLYPRMLRAHVKPWIWTIIGIGSLGTLMTIAGIAVGFWQARWRRRRADGRRLAFTPYRTAWMQWHHWSGLAFGLATFTWIFSGTMSVTPFDWSPGEHATTAEREAFAGGTLEHEWQGLGAQEVVGMWPPGALRELEPRVMAGISYWIAFDATGQAHAISAMAGTKAPLTDDEIREAVRAMHHDASIAAVDRLDRYDDYYYAASEARRKSRPLPVVRVRFDDTDQTTYYIDPERREFVMRQGSRSRLERWLYRGLHDLDFAILAQHPPLRQLVVILLSIGGLALSITGIVGAWRWVASKSGIPAGARR